MKIDIYKDQICMWCICEAVGAKHHLIDQMQFDEDKLVDVQLIVGGVELDFTNVLHRMVELYDKAVTEKAQELLSDKYGDLFIELDDIRERIKEQKNRFLYEWESKGD